MPRLSGVLSALSDLVFKFIFGTEERKELLRELVNIVLARVGLPLAAKLTLRNPFNLKQFEGDKASILDIGATDETGRMFDIEVHLSWISSVVRHRLPPASAPHLPTSSKPYWHRL